MGRIDGGRGIDYMRSCGWLGSKWAQVVTERVAGLREVLEAVARHNAQLSRRQRKTKSTVDEVGETSGGGSGGRARSGRGGSGGGSTIS